MEPEYASIIADEVNVKTIAFDAAQTERVLLDTALSAELLAEGAARDFMRAVQDMRKTTGLQPSDRIMLNVETSEEGRRVLELFKELIVKTVGADEIVFGPTEGLPVSAGDLTFTVALRIA
jgi:hypothetical protein